VKAKKRIDYDYDNDNEEAEPARIRPISAGHTLLTAITPEKLVMSEMWGYSGATP
jgi:hypothetical protein